MWHQQAGKRSRRGGAARLGPGAGLGLLCAALVLGGCGASGPGLSSTCKDFVGMSAADQTKVASEWSNPARDGKTNQLSDAIASDSQQKLLTYCQQSGHASDKIGDLEATIG